MKKESFRKRFNKVWNDKDVKTNGLIRRVGEGDIDSTDQEQHKPEVIDRTKEMIR